MSVVWLLSACSWSPEPAPPPQGLQVEDRYQVHAAIVHGALAVYPVTDRTPPQIPEGDFDSLEETMAAGTLRINELSESGSVPQLQAKNTGDAPVLMLAGEVIIGGKQDRILTEDTIVAPGEHVLIDVNCVEQGRWARNGTFAYGGRSELGLKRVVEISRNQGDTWAAVAVLNGRKELAPPSGTYGASLGSKRIRRTQRAALQTLAPALAELDNVVGVVVAVDEELVGAEVFGHPDGFEGRRTALLRGLVLDALSDEDDGDRPLPTQADAAAFLREALHAQVQPREANMLQMLGYISGEEVVGTVSRDPETEALQHLNVYSY